jgi:hypothetical protein
MGRPGPTFLIAGAGRAGTTGLVEGLRAHPDVFVTTPKEPHYLAMHGATPAYRGPGDEATINRQAVTDESSYRALFPTESHHLAYGEGSVSTFYHHERSLPELLRVNPDMRVVVLLREPVSRAYSSFQYLRAQGREPEEDFMAALDDEPRRRADNWHHLWHYTAMSRYAESVAAFSDQLPRGHLGVWFHDDLERDYAGTLAAVVRFLGLDPMPDGELDVPRVNISGTPRYQRLQQGIWWASGHPAVRGTARRITSWRFREAVKSRLIKRQDVPEAIRRAVAPEFEEDLHLLRDLVGDKGTLPDWLRAPSGARA